MPGFKPKPGYIFKLGGKEYIMYKDLLMDKARGSWQRELVSELDRGVLDNPIRRLQGKARSYQGKYSTSFDNLIRRLVDSGFIVIKKLGPRGGSWGSTYSIAGIARGISTGALIVVHPKGDTVMLESYNELWGKSYFSPSTYTVGYERYIGGIGVK